MDWVVWGGMDWVGWGGMDWVGEMLCGLLYITRPSSFYFPPAAAHR